MTEKGLSHVAYFRTDGGSSKLYTQEYVDELKNKIEILEKENTRLGSSLYRKGRVIDKAIDYITTEQLYTNYQWGKSQYVKILKDLLEILRVDKELKENK